MARGPYYDGLQLVCVLQIQYGWLGEPVMTYFPAFVPKFENEKIPNSLCPVEGWGGGRRDGWVSTCCSTFVPEFKNDKRGWRGGWGGVGGCWAIFQLLFPSSKIIKFQDVTCVIYGGKYGIKKGLLCGHLEPQFGGTFSHLSLVLTFDTGFPCVQI